MQALPDMCAGERMGGCTLLGALSVTTGVLDSVSLIHGPPGCVHHNFSLIHATLQETGAGRYPGIRHTSLGEEEIIFGGEGALEEGIKAAAAENPAVIYVLTACIAETIGDDVQAVCRGDFGIPVIPIPTSGFLGGGFERGLVNALRELSRQARQQARDPSCITVIGEKNLEYEVEENFIEVKRLLGLLGLEIQLRLARGITAREIQRLGASSLNILREPALVPIGEELRQRFGTPCIPSFPVGLRGTIEFLKEVGTCMRLDPAPAIRSEMELQTACIQEYSDLAGTGVRIDPDGRSPEYIREAVRALGLVPEERGAILPQPVPPPVGTAGMRRLLRRWRRAIDA